MVLEQTQFKKHSIINSNNIFSHAMKDNPTHSLGSPNITPCMKKAGEKKKKKRKI